MAEIARVLPYWEVHRWDFNDKKQPVWLVVEIDGQTQFDNLVDAVFAYYAYIRTIEDPTLVQIVKFTPTVEHVMRGRSKDFRTKYETG